MMYSSNSKFLLPSNTRVINLALSEKHENPKSPLKYAIVEIGGTQTIVEEGRYYTCNRLKAEIGSKVRFGRVLAVQNNGDLRIGTPWIETALVEAQIIGEHLDNKIIVYKMNSKKHTRKKTGHRQLKTR